MLRWACALGAVQIRLVAAQTLSASLRSSAEDMVNQLGVNLSKMEEKTEYEKALAWWTAPKHDTTPTLEGVFNFNDIPEMFKIDEMPDQFAEEHANLRSGLANVVQNLEKWAFLGYGGSDDDRSEPAEGMPGGGGLYAAKIPGAQKDQEEWQREAETELKKVERGIPAYASSAQRKVSAAIEGATEELAEGFKSTKTAWEAQADRMAGVRDNTGKFDNMFTNVANDLKLLIGKGNQSQENVVNKANSNVASMRKRLIAGLNKYQKRVVSRLKAASLQAKNGIARYMADTPLKYQKLERATSTALNEASVRVMGMQERLLEKIERANTKGEKSRGLNLQTHKGIAQMNEDRVEMEGKLQGEYTAAKARLDGRVATERKLTQTVAASLLNELMQTFALANKTIAAEGRDAKQSIVDEHKLLMHNADERIKSVQDEIKLVHRNVNKLIVGGKVGMRRIEQWTEDKKKHLSGITMQGELISRLNDTVREKLRERNVALDAANTRLWKSIDDPSNGQVQRTADAVQRAQDKLKDQLDVAESKLADDYDLARIQVLGTGPMAAQLQIENFTTGLEGLLSHYKENFLLKVKENLTRASSELSKLADTTVPDLLEQVTEKANEARNETEDERVEVRSQAAKVMKYLEDKLGSVAKRVQTEKSGVDALAKGFRQDADQNVTDIETDVNKILYDAETEFGKEKTDETASAHFLLDNTKELLGQWAADVAKSTAKQNQLRVAAAELKATDEQGIAEATQATQDAAASLKTTIATEMDQQVATMVAEQKALVPVHVKALEHLTDELRHTEKAQADILEHNVQRADATLDQHEDILRKLKENEDKIKTSNSAFVQQAIAKIDGVKGQVAAGQLLAGSAWKQRKQMLAAKVDALTATLRRRIQFTEGSAHSDMEAAAAAAKGELAKLVLLEDGSQEDAAQTILRGLEDQVKQLDRGMFETQHGLKELDRIKDLSDEVSEEVTETDGSIKGASQAENLAENAASTAESQQLLGLAQQTRDILELVRNAEQHVDHALARARENHEQLMDQVDVQVSAIKERARLAGEKVKDRVGNLNTNVLAVEKQLKIHEMRLGHLLDGSKAIVEGSLAHVAQGLREEKKHLQEGAKKVIMQASAGIGRILQGLTGLTGNLSPLMDTMQQRMDSAEEEEARWTAAFDKAEALERHHADADVEQAAEKARAAQFAWSKFSHWKAGFSAKDLAWKELVHGQLNNYGVELNSSVTDLLRTASGLRSASSAAARNVEAHVDQELGVLERETNGKIDQVFAAADARISEVLANEKLSDAEKEKLVAKIEADAHAQRARILREQTVLQRKQAALQAGLEHYQVLVAAAKDATQRAVDSGMLAPSIRALNDNLHNVTAQIHVLKQSPFLLHAEVFAEANATTDGPTSSANTSVPGSLLEARSLSRDNELLAAANARLAAHVAAVEQQLSP